MPHFWTIESDVHECWRIDDVTFRSFQRIGECRRDREHGGFRAARYRLPAIFPECRNFSAIEDAQNWIVEALN